MSVPTPNSTNKDTLLERIEREKKIAELQRDTLAAQSAIIEQIRPAAGDKAAEGKVELANVEIEAYVMGIQAVDKAAEAVAKRIWAYNVSKAKENSKTYLLKTLLIYNEADAIAVRQYHAFQLFTQTVSDAYIQLLKADQNEPQPQLESAVATIAPALLIKGGSVALQAAANILSFFRTDVKIAGVKIEPGEMESALVASLVQHLHQETTQGATIDVYYPAKFPLETSRRATGIVQHLATLQYQRNQAEEKVKELSNQVAPTVEDQALISEFQNTNAVYDRFVGALLTPGSSGDVNNLLLLMRGAALQGELDNGAHWLQLQVQKAGGNLITRTSGLLRRSTFTCSGGAIVTYIIVDRDMKVVLSGKEIGYLGQRDLQEVGVTL